MAIVNTYFNGIMTDVAADVAKVTAHPADGTQINEAITLGTANISFDAPSTGTSATISMTQSSVDISITEPEATGVKYLMLRDSLDNPIDLKVLTTAVGISGDEIEKIIRINDWTIDGGTTDV